MESSKKAWSPPFSPAETSSLVDLISKYGKILDSKVTGISKAEKDAAWKDIGQKFNAQGLYIHRNEDTLKNKWKLLKRDAKNEYRSHKKYSNGTGGGPPPKELSDLYLAIVKVTGEDCIEGGKGSPDSDTCLINGTSAKPTINNVPVLVADHSTCQETHTWEESQENIGLEIQDVLESSMQEPNENVDIGNFVWNGYTPTMLKQIPSKPLKEPHPSTSKPHQNSVNWKKNGKEKLEKNVYTKNCEKKFDVLNLQEEHFQKEAELLKLKFKNEKERHELFTKEYYTKQKRDIALFEADEVVRTIKSRRDTELFELEKKKMKLEIDLLKKQIAYEPDEENNN